jgi:hypothetical protein
VDALLELAADDRELGEGGGQYALLEAGVAGEEEPKEWSPG